MTDESSALLTILAKVFTPAAPIETKEFFAGRLDQIATCLAVLQQPGRHVAIYGSRGVGKTSFANVMRILSDTDNSHASKVSCDSGDTYEALWRKVLSQLQVPFRTKETRAGFNVDPAITERTVPADSFFRDNNVSAGEIGKVLGLLDAPTVIIFDEFDRLPKAFEMRLFADTVKLISDTVPDVTLLIVGVADTINDLIGEHASIQRNLAQINLPVMSAEELSQIVAKGLEALGMRIDQSVTAKIVEFSDGYPHYTHLLSYHAAFRSVVADRRDIGADDFRFAVNRSIEEAHETLRNDYQKATLATKKNIFREVLWAAASVKLDENQSFQALDLQEPLSKILSKKVKVVQFHYHLGKLSTPDRGSILRSIGSRNRRRYKFANPLMRPFIKMHVYHDPLATRT